MPLASTNGGASTRTTCTANPRWFDVPTALRSTPAGAAIPRVQDVLQVWFSGVHSDVGGSYPQLQSGLANITLEWMIEETKKADAKFD